MPELEAASRIRRAAPSIRPRGLGPRIGVLPLQALPVTPEEGRELVWANEKEKPWQQACRGWLDFAGWTTHAVYDSRHSPEGWPDLTAAHPVRGLLIFFELKTETGRLTPKQRLCLAVLRAVAAVDPRVFVGVYRPHQADELRAFLLGQAEEPPPSCDEPIRSARRSPARLGR
jgi:hypothetical protein